MNPSEIGLLIGLSVGTIFGVGLMGVLSAEARARAEAAAFNRGVAYGERTERSLRGDDATELGRLAD